MQAQSSPDTTALHCLQVPISLAARVRAASLIVEAEAGTAVASWDASHQHIYTRQSLHVLHVFKGIPSDTLALPLLAEGGQVGLDQQLLTNTFSPLAEGKRGIFFLIPAPWPGLAAAGYTPYGSTQGVIVYEAATGTAADPFHTYTSVAAAVAEIVRLIGNTSLVNPIKNSQAQPLAQAGPLLRTTASITSFSPSALVAGVGAVLTIQGSGFGASQGTGNVSFQNADNGGATTNTPRQADYLSWSDTQIRVRVPSSGSNGQPAGTGAVRVVAADGSITYTATPLIITYALTNVNTAAAGLSSQPSHVATNATGGLTFHFGPNFQNSAAVAPWQRALAQWRCSTGINWNLAAAATTNAITNDNQNVVAFDTGSDLPAGTLGRTTTYYKGCYDAQGRIVFYTQEIDQQYASPSPTLSFQYGPALATGQQIDFESVFIHELGHAQQLAHVIQPGAVMHYIIGRGQNQRTLNLSSDVVGGRRVLRTLSFRDNGCSGPALLPAPLTSLSAEATGLRFTTQNECFLSSFVLERTLGADTISWQAVATTPAGLVNGQYSLTDPQPALGLHYYRLGLRRPDGSIDYTTPLPSDSNAQVADSHLFPNPIAGTQAQLTYVAAVNETLTIYIYDELGRLHHQATATVRAGLNVLPVEVGGLLTGFYLLRLTSTQGISQNIRLVRL